MDSESGPLPDPVAYARARSDEALDAYREEYGEDSREWVIAYRELRRRRMPHWLRGIYDRYRCAYWLPF